MSWTNLKAAIATAIKTNNNQEITGVTLQNILISIVNSVGANATFGGVATPSTNPGTPDGPVLWFVGQGGQYPNFNNTTVSDNVIGVFVFDGNNWAFTVIANIGKTLYYSLDSKSTFSITNKLTNCSTNSSKKSVNYGEPYSATITVKAGYTLDSISVKMGDRDVTSSVYSEGKITITRVTDDVVITAVATSDSDAGLFDNASWFNGFWSINTSNNTATPSSTKSYLGTYFFGVPTKNYTISPKTINGYNVAFRFYLCHSVNGTTANEVTKSNAYGNISGAAATSVNTDTIKALDSSASYLAITIWAKATSGSGNLDLSNETFEDLLTIS